MKDIPILRKSKNEIIKIVQKEYPENSREAIGYAVELHSKEILNFLKDILPYKPSVKVSRIRKLIKFIEDQNDK